MKLGQHWVISITMKLYIVTHNLTPEWSFAMSIFITQSFIFFILAEHDDKNRVVFVYDWLKVARFCSLFDVKISKYYRNCRYLLKNSLDGFAALDGFSNDRCFNIYISDSIVKVSNIYTTAIMSLNVKLQILQNKAII